MPRLPTIAQTTSHRSRIAMRLHLNHHRLLATAVVAALLNACAAPAAKLAEEQGFSSCESPRTSMCTREYRPVCGHVDTGIRCVTQPCDASNHRTYSNACTACADEQVIGYEIGSCASYGKGQ